MLPSDVLTKVQSLLESRDKLVMSIVFPELEFTVVDRRLGMIQYALDHKKLQPYFSTTRYIYEHLNHPTAKLIWPATNDITRRVIVLEDAITCKKYDDAGYYPSLEAVGRQDVCEELIDHVAKQSAECFDAFQRTKWFAPVFSSTRWHRFMKLADWKLVDHVNKKIEAGEIQGWSLHVFNNFICEDMIAQIQETNSVWWSDILSAAISCGKIDLAMLIMDKGHKLLQ